MSHYKEHKKIPATRPFRKENVRALKLKKESVKL